MTDVHCHVTGGETGVREWLVGRDFFGYHPWSCLGLLPPADDLAKLRATLLEHPTAGVGEIGLDRLKVRTVSPAMRELFEAQLHLAFQLNRPVVLHGAKCWGQVVAAIRQVMRTERTSARAQPRFLFHGFSRSDGLIPDIVALDGYISVGPAVLNDHAVNYHAMIKKIPLERLLVETDRTLDTAATGPSVRQVLNRVAQIRGMTPSELESITDDNAERFR